MLLLLLLLFFLDVIVVAAAAAAASVVVVVFFDVFSPTTLCVCEEESAPPDSEVLLGAACQCPQLNEVDHGQTFEVAQSVCTQGMSRGRCTFPSFSRFSRPIVSASPKVSHKRVFTLIR